MNDLSNPMSNPLIMDMLLDDDETITKTEQPVKTPDSDISDSVGIGGFVIAFLVVSICALALFSGCCDER